MATNAMIINEMTEFLGIQEEVHTYQKWQELGKQVTKGSKALFSCKIWRQCKGKKTVDVVKQVDEKQAVIEDGKPSEKLYLVKASFFGLSQTKPIKQLDDGNTIDVAAEYVKPAAGLLEAWAEKTIADIKASGPALLKATQEAIKASKKNIEPAMTFSEINKRMVPSKTANQWRKEGKQIQYDVEYDPKAKIPAVKYTQIDIATGEIKFAYQTENYGKQGNLHVGPYSCKQSVPKMEADAKQAIEIAKAGGMNKWFAKQWAPKYSTPNFGTK